MRYLFLYLVLVLCTLAPFALHGQAVRKYIRQGNSQYREGAYDESEISYRKALEKDNQSFEGEFNLGDALYKQEKFGDAARSFNYLADQVSEKQKLGQIYHNLGNALLKDNRVEESIEAYKQALRNNPRDDQTRHNLAFAQQLLQQQQQQENQDQQQQDQQQQEQQQDQQQQDQQQQEQQQDQQQESQPQQISREDAERMLQALQQEEQKLQEKLKKQQARAKSVRVLKDW